MFRSLVSLFLGLALLGTTPATAAAATADLPTASADRSAPSTVPEVVERRVRLGHRPIRLQPDSRTARLTFQARRGQIVNLVSWSGSRPCLTTRLRRRGSPRDLRSWKEGYWRLRSTGTYTAVATRCPGTAAAQVPTKVQVREAVVREAEVDGPAFRIGFNHDVTHLVKVPLAEGERLEVDDIFKVSDILLPGHDTPEPVSQERIFLEVGTQPAYGDAVSSVGDHYFVASPDQRGTIRDSPIRVVRVLQHRGRLDGPELTLPDRGVAGRSHVVAFDAPAGAWVYGVATSPSGKIVATTEILDPDGRSMTHYGATQLPTSGTYRMQVRVPWSLNDRGSWGIPWTRVEDGPLRLRIRTAAVAEPLVVDGPPVTYAATTPGQWVIGPYTEGIGSEPVEYARVTVSDVAPSGTDWHAAMYTGRANSCSPDDSSMGCGDYSWASFGPPDTGAFAPPDWHAGPSMVLITYPPTVQGSLKLTLTTHTP